MSEMVENQDTKWYVLRVVSGKEKKVKEYLDKEIRLSGWSAIILQVFCPVEKIFKVVGGKKALREKNSISWLLNVGSFWKRKTKR